MAACGVQQSNLDELPLAEAIDEARAEHLNHHVDAAFSSTPEVLGTPHGSGIAASQRFFDTSDTVVLSEDLISAKLRAASVAVVAHAPMLTMTPNNRAEVLAEVARLQARYVLLVGNVDVATTAGSRTVIQDPGSLAALGQLTALKFTPQRVEHEADAAAAVAGLEADEARVLVPHWEGAPLPEPAKKAEADEPVHAFPAQARRDADTDPLVVATKESSIAAVATARAHGATVRIMEHPDPRYSRSTVLAVAGLAQAPLIALGSQFGTAPKLSERIDIAERARAELPGGTGVVRSGRPVFIGAHQGTSEAPSISGSAMKVIRQTQLAEIERRVSQAARQGKYLVLRYNLNDPHWGALVEQTSAVWTNANVAIQLDATGAAALPAAVRNTQQRIARSVREGALTQKPLIVTGGQREAEALRSSASSTPPEEVARFFAVLPTSTTWEGLQAGLEEASQALGPTWGYGMVASAALIQNQVLEQQAPNGRLALRPRPEWLIEATNSGGLMDEVASRPSS